MLTIADSFTLARLALAPVVVLGYLLLPAEPVVAFWVCGWLCGFAEITDYLDGRIARLRREVSDFGKLADPFCDVFYRLSVFLVLLLPIGGLGHPLPEHGFCCSMMDGQLFGPLVYRVTLETGDHAARCGMVPFLPVLIMVLREVVAGALRSMAATQGLVLAARPSGKVKAWFQGITIVGCFSISGLLFRMESWHLYWSVVMTWFCAVVSASSMGEYIWVNRRILARLMLRNT